MKTVSDDLFRLVKSLTPLEKGYFKKFAARNTPGEKNNYIILFDAVDNMNSYDEELLCRKLKHVSFTKQLPVYKNYLYNLILKSLFSNSTYETIDLKINELIQNSSILIRKAMHKEALKYLKKAKAIAAKFEKSKSLLEILAMERSIIMSMPDKHTYDSRMKLYNEELLILKSLEKQLKLSWLSDDMVLHVEFKGDYRVKEKEIKKIMSDPVLKEYDKLKDFTSKKFILHIHLFEQFAKEEIKKVHYYLKKEIDLVQDYKFMIPSIIRTYIQTLINYLLFSNILKDRNNEAYALKKINELKRNIKSKIPLDMEIMLLSNICYAEIIISTNNCGMHKGRVTAKKIEELLSKYSSEIPLALRVVLLINTAKFWFIDRNFENALRMINCMINEVPPAFKQDLYDFSKLFQLLIHFELGNFILLENTVESTYRFLNNRKSLFDVETAIIEFLRKMLRAQENEYKEIYEELLLNLEKSADKIQSKITMGNFNFIMWAKSKIMNKPIIELMKAGN
ncbi:MAG: hypothetical protein EHM58_03180 [Ignavibacteriae bacterium]|nr:MAG: hypothetical protein EHM58_03180 [Ignavibacteriota bacterium]